MEVSGRWVRAELPGQGVAGGICRDGYVRPSGRLGADQVDTAWDQCRVQIHVGAEHHVTPRIHHSACMVDPLGLARKLDETTYIPA
jgi:hypothetical protein